MTSEYNSKFNFKNNLDIVVALGVIGIVMMIIIPLPKMVLDVMLAINKMTSQFS